MPVTVYNTQGKGQLHDPGVHGQGGPEDVLGGSEQGPGKDGEGGGRVVDEAGHLVHGGGFAEEIFFFIHKQGCTRDGET